MKKKHIVIVIVFWGFFFLISKTKLKWQVTASLEYDCQEIVCFVINHDAEGTCLPSHVMNPNKPLCWRKFSQYLVNYFISISRSELRSPCQCREGTQRAARSPGTTPTGSEPVPSQNLEIPLGCADGCSALGAALPPGLNTPSEKYQGSRVRLAQWTLQ